MLCTVKIKPKKECGSSWMIQLVVFYLFVCKKGISPDNE